MKRMTISRSVVLVVFVIMANPTPSPSLAEDAPTLTKDQGPFLVLAYVFRGNVAEAQAKALANELKTDHKLDAYLYENPEKPEEFHVYVGDCKTNRESFDLKNRVKKINAKSLPNRANPERKGHGLSRAMTMKNPLAEAR